MLEASENMSIEGNVTSCSTTNATVTSVAQLVFESTSYVMYTFILPTLCVVGFAGNILTLTVLTRRRRAAESPQERSATAGLTSLAVADLLFCVCAFPSIFIPLDNTYASRGVVLFYARFAPALINVFILASTWLTLNMAVERYFAVCHVMKWTSSISVKRTKLIIAATFLASAIFNTPVLWRYRVQSLTSCSDDVTTFSLEQQVFVSSVWDHAYRAAWAVCGNIVPVILLTLLHFRLSRAIHQASRASALLKHQSTARRRRRDGSGRSARSNDERNSRRITRTLLAIVVMFLVLVAPSEIVKQLAVFAGGEQMQSNYVYLTLEVVTNVTQSVNFCANFILYCCVNPSFRQQVRDMFCRRNSRRRNVDDTTRARGTEMVEEDDVDECCDMTSRRAWRSRSSERHGLNGSAV